MQSELRKKLLDAFTNSDGEYLSGQLLGDLLGISRAAVWKHIEELRKEGFELEAVRRKGYRILKTTKKVTADEIRLGLKTKFIGQNIHYEDSVDSTQKVALQLGLNGAKEGTIVIAEEQVSGRGRMERPWHSPKYTGVWMSLIIRPNIPIQNAPQLTLLTAVAVVQAIEEVTTLSPQIKWPNDILLNGKKITGILTELQAEADCIKSIIIGIGINVNQKLQDYPQELQEIATSLAIEAKKEINRAELIRAVFTKFEKLYDLYLQSGFQPIKLLWESYAISIGKTITARTLTKEIKGKALGITEDGVLKLEDEYGEIHYIYSADIDLENK
ncbi:biotin--[acetyl-CoA-carboxylase] ligase [Cytobacillus sp. Hz8]|uniref:biotin--[acetyl-CoA-carboxylase] ligase n=1 Tax=Cytobacillus sp. Hz8 TaxID=3347168 RepID=UPI0035DF3555